MRPTLYSGDYIIATSLFKSFFLKNKLIVFFDKAQSYVVKRVLNYQRSILTLKSDNESTSSKFCGKKIHKSQVSFVVLLIIKKKNRI